MYSNVSGTRPISKNGPAFLVLGSFSSVSELVGHINRVYGKGGPQCTILQTPKNTFVPLLSPKDSMLQYPVERAAVHTKALMSLYTSRRKREKKEFDNARQEKRPGIVNKSSRDVQKRIQRLQDIGLDVIPEDAKNGDGETQPTTAPGASTTEETTPETTDTTTTDTSKTATTESEENDESEASIENEATSESQSVKTSPKNVIAPLNTNIKLANQNFAVVSIIHDERKGRISPNDAHLKKNANKHAPLEPIVSFLETFDSQKEAEEYAKKANSREVPGAPLFVVQMYSWLFTEAISMDSVPVAYPEQPMLERLINNHQKVQEKGEEEYIRSLEEDDDNAIEDGKENTKMKVLEAKQPSLTQPQRLEAPDEKVPAIRAADVNAENNEPSEENEEEEHDMKRAIDNDCVLNILKTRVLREKSQ